MKYIISLYLATKDGFIKQYDVARYSTYDRAEKKTRYLNQKLGVKEDDLGFMYCPKGTRFYMFE
jgi:hypothetical protein